MIPLFKVFTSEKCTQAVSDVLRSGYTGQGPVSDKFESELNKHFSTDNGVLVNSATSGIHLVLRYLKDFYGWDDSIEVLSTCLGCYLSTCSILNNNYKIKWCDIEPVTGNIDLLDAERKLSEKTRVLFLVHTSGNAVDLDGVERLKSKYRELYGNDLIVIEDCAHTWEGYYKGKLIGSPFNDNFKVFSFQSIKHLSSVDGGFIICPTHHSSKTLKLMRWAGLDRTAGASFRSMQDVTLPYCYKFQPNDVHSSIGLCNLQEVSANVKRHRDNAEYYNHELDSVRCIQLIPTSYDSSHWLYGIHVPRRDDFIKEMASKGIETSPVQSSMAKHTAVRQFRCSLPNMDKFAKSIVYIPVGYWVTEKGREFIISCIKDGW